MSTGARVEWFCSGLRCMPGGRLFPPTLLCNGRVPHLHRESWVRYRRPLEELPPADITLSRLDAGLMERLRQHPERDEPQVRSAFRFWQAGFGEGYVWMDGAEPLCMMWLVTSDHAAARSALGPWAGIYPPVPPWIAVAEGLYTFRRGLRYPGGAATPTAWALFHLARRRGMSELRTHIHSANTGAIRWATRVGWQPFGAIHRCHFDLRWLRERPFYLHERHEFPQPEIPDRRRMAATE